MKAWLVTLTLFGLVVAQGCLHGHHEFRPADRPFQPGRETDRSCVECHGDYAGEHDSPTMHDSLAVKIGCTDCHGGDATASEKEKAHVQPRHPKYWPSSANPERLYAKINKEDPAFIRFVNPGDLRVASVTCGECHPSEVRRVRKSMMAHGSMLWGAALYNNGVVPFKNPRFGEAYGPDGTPLRLKAGASGRSEQGRTAVPRSAAALRGGAAGQHAARVRTRRALPSVAARPSEPVARARQARQGVVAARTRHAQPHRPGVAQPCRRRGYSIRCCTCWAPTIIRAITVRRDARRAT